MIFDPSDQLERISKKKKKRKELTGLQCPGDSTMVKSYFLKFTNSGTGFFFFSFSFFGYIAWLVG